MVRLGRDHHSKGRVLLRWKKVLLIMAGVVVLSGALIVTNQLRVPVDTQPKHPVFEQEILDRVILKLQKAVFEIDVEEGRRSLTVHVVMDGLSGDEWISVLGTDGRNREVTVSWDFREVVVTDALVRNGDVFVGGFKIGSDLSDLTWQWPTVITGTIQPLNKEFRLDLPPVI